MLPSFVTNQFYIIDKRTTNHIDYSGPFNALLNSLFPASDGYQIAVQSQRIAGSIDFTVMFLLERTTPVIIVHVQVMTNVAYETPSSRKAADEQMRESIHDASTGLDAMPKLYGLSFFGTRFCVYEYTHSSGTLTPRRIGVQPDIITDTAPKERWNLDILKELGKTRLEEIVGHIKTMINDYCNELCCYPFSLSLNLLDSMNTGRLEDLEAELSEGRWDMSKVIVSVLFIRGSETDTIILPSSESDPEQIDLVVDSEGM